MAIVKKASFWMQKWVILSTLNELSLYDDLLWRVELNQTDAIVTISIPGQSTIEVPLNEQNLTADRINACFVH